MSNSPSRFHGTLVRGLLAGVVLLTSTSAAQANPSPFNPLIEAQNFSIQLQQPAVYSTPQAQALLRKISNQNTADALTIQSSDSARTFEGNLCWSGTDACAGDARLYDWQRKGYGIAAPVLYTARNGAQISGHVWATRSGPRRRPGIVITGGSYGAPERLYWYLAQALAKNGYVVMTWDPQGQGLSDTFGQPPDQTEGVPVQRDGRPFFDGTEDAIDFFLSTAQKPYVPTTSCSSGTSHAATQSSRVRARLDNAYNPYAAMLDPTKKIGSVGSSYGAAAVSWVSVRDTRVGAIVALDNIGPPSTRDPQAFPPGAAPCPGHPDQRGDLLTDRTRLAHLAKPILGLSADYYVPPTPNLSAPPDAAYCAAVEQQYARGAAVSRDDTITCKSLGSQLYSSLGVDSGEVVIRGGTHYDFSYSEDAAFPASLRGYDITTWYASAWFDKYVKGDRTADARLLTDRWRHNAAEAAVDPGGDGNAYSFYHLSRMDMRTVSGARVDCEDLRAGCPSLTSDDGVEGEYSYPALDTSLDRKHQTVAARTCTSHRTVTVHLQPRRGHRLTSVVARVGSRVIGRSRTRRVALRLIGLPRGQVTVWILERMRNTRTGKTSTLRTKRRYRTCGAKA